MIRRMLTTVAVVAVNAAAARVLSLLEAVMPESRDGGAPEDLLDYHRAMCEITEMAADELSEVDVVMHLADWEHELRADA